MSNRFKQVNDFINGMNTDIDERSLNQSSYRHALNMQLTEADDVMALSNMTGTIEYTTGSLANPHIPSGFKFVGAFVGHAYTFDEKPSEQIIAFAQNDSGQAQIFQIDALGQSVMKLYDDLQKPVTVPNPRATGLNLGDKIDCYILRDGDESYAYWVDDENPPRYLKLGVESNTLGDYSVAPYSNLYIPNEEDLLYVQRLFPVDPLSITNVIPSGGSLLAGSYSFAYRYYNSTSEKYSTWSLISNPVPVIQDDTSSVSTNDIAGYAPGATTSKSIELTVAKSDYHHRLYNSIQIAIIRNTGISGSPLTVSTTTPSRDYYGGIGSDSVIVITGNEGLTDSVLSDITVEDASLMTGMTLEESNNRFFIGNIKYWDLSIGAQSNITAQTVKENLPVPVDPLDSQPAAGQGYYDEMNNHDYRGYFRGEVYRFGLTYVNKFGHWARPTPMDFSGAGLSYNPSDHVNTWQLNWSSSGDWKFADRESAEGSIFDSASDAISAFGLQVGGIDNHPDWAYGMSIVRLDRKKDILGQTPIINGTAYQGGAFQTGYYDVLFEEGWTRYFYESDASFDYDGSQDFFGPKIMAQGHAKNLTYGMLQMGADYRSNHHYLVWERLGTKQYGVVNPTYDQASYDGKTYKKRTNSFLFLYPLEYMANVGGEESSDILLDGTESLNIIDAVALTGFNSYRDSKFSHGIAASEVNFKDGTESRYSWVFSPKNKGAYYYHNGHPAGLMLADGVAVSPVFPVINVAPSDPVRISGGYKFDWASPPEVLNSPHSNDDPMRHIRYLLNGTELAAQQTSNDDSFWKDINMCAPYPVVSQRGLAVSIAIDDDGDNTLNMIADPTYFVWSNYVDGTPSVPFSTLFPGNTDIDDTAVAESYKATSQTTAEWDLAKADFSKTPMIDPDSTVITYIANITKGLGDDRYGDSGTAQSYIFTGAYEPITKAMIDASTPVQKDVFGGDCFITRNTFQLRTNAPRKDEAIIDEPNIGSPERWHIEEGSSGYYYIDQAHKATTFVEFAEIVDLWVESEINGHYVFRDKGKYPSGVNTRDAGSTDYIGTPDYSYPESGMSTYSDSRRYLYNPAYSAGNEHKVFLSRDLNERILDHVPARFHYSNERIINTSISSDRFLPLDYYDLDPSHGELNKLVESDHNRLMGIQDNGVALMNLGSTMTTDADGLTVNLKSGDVIGYMQYLSSNSETGGDVGAQRMSMVRKGDGAVWFLDESREALFSVSGGRIKNHSDGRIHYSSNFKTSSKRGEVGYKNRHTAWYDNRLGKYGFYHSPFYILDDERGGASYMTRREIWETEYEFGVTTHLIDLCFVESRKFYFINDLTTNTGRIMWNSERMVDAWFNGSFIFNQNETLLLDDNIGQVGYIVNNGEHRDAPKSLINVISHSDRPPTHLDILIRGGFGFTDQGASFVPFRKQRHNMYIANEFRSVSSGQRMKDANAYVLLYFDASINGLARVSSIITTYRLDHRRIT